MNNIKCSIDERLKRKMGDKCTKKTFICYTRHIRNFINLWVLYSYNSLLPNALYVTFVLGFWSHDPSVDVQTINSNKMLYMGYKVFFV